jgi:hypothetical protein
MKRARFAEIKFSLLDITEKGSGVARLAAARYSLILLH